MLEQKAYTNGLELVEDCKIVMLSNNGEDGCEIYYPLGIDDPGYTVLCFTAVSGNYYHGLENKTFKIDKNNNAGGY